MHINAYYNSAYIFILFTKDSSSSTRSKSTFIMSPSSVGKKRANLAIKPDTSLFTAAEPLALSNKPKKASVCYKKIKQHKVGGTGIN